MTGFVRRFLANRVAPWVSLALALAVALVLEAGVSSQEEPQGDPKRIVQSLEILSRIPTGRELLKRAQRFWGISRFEDLKTKMKWGRTSRTDAVLTRRFNPKTGQESRDRQVTIYLREDQGLDDTVLDLAHELVHATSRPAWDPYDPDLTQGRYVWAAIEGEGGEVEAVAAECRVGFELNFRYGFSGLSSERCRGYLESAASPGQGPSRDGRLELSVERIRKDFYRVGRWKRELAARLGPELSLFPLLSPETPSLYSSTGNAPYPVALLKEFAEITQIACDNSRQRMSATASRSPASAQRNAQDFLVRRCGTASASAQWQ